MPNAKRILIYGVTGSGKTTLAARLSEITGIPWTEVDSLTWEPGWTEVPVDEQRARIQACCEAEAWILDSAYAKWIDIPLSKVELIVGLDFPRWISLGRLIKRTLARAIDRRSICNGNTESFRTAFSRDSILVWHFRSFRRKADRIRQWERDGTVSVIRFTRPSQVEDWLSSLASRSDSSNTAGCQSALGLNSVEK